MSGHTLIDLQIECAREREKYIRDLEGYLRRIKEVCMRFDPECRLLVFGSFVRGSMRVDSDVDVLVISRCAGNATFRAMLRAAIAGEIGLVTPFEIHIITPEEYEAWYKKFIDVYREI